MAGSYAWCSRGEVPYGPGVSGESNRRALWIAGSIRSAGVISAGETVR
jgi:hypothetical protein